MKQKSCIKLILIILIDILVGCSSSKKITNKNTLKTPTRIVFQKTNSISKSGVDHFIASLKVEKAKDTTALAKEQQQVLDEFYEFLKVSLMNNQSTKVVIEINNDTIWKHKTIKGKQIGDFEVKFKRDSIRHMVGKDRKTFYATSKLRFSKEKHTITEYPNDIKIIKGIKCYKIIVEIEGSNIGKSGFPLGKTIHELYVTKELDLPMHTFFNYHKIMPNIFPLEVKLKSEGLTGMEDIYNLTELVY